MIDLNKFKSINDTYGHLNGDLALVEFSKALYKQFENDKVVGRYAGDEFVLILGKKKIDETQKSLAAVKSEMEKIYEFGKLEFLIEFSYGYYERSENEDISYNDIIHIADQKMYESKRLKAEKYVSANNMNI